MGLFKRNRDPGSPARRPHPDARAEVALQRILSLQKAVMRREDLLAQNQAQIAHLRDTVTQHPNWEGHTKRLNMIADLLGENDGLDAEVVKLHDEIASRVGDLSDTDLAYLQPEPGAP